MKDVYELCPDFESGKWLLRFVRKEDAADLLAVYGDKNALPFFNSDNCHGDNFYYNTKEKMDKAIDFWLYSYEQKYFVRWTVIDKSAGKAVGTIELFHRPAGADFGDVGLIRLDVGSGYERAEPLKEILSLIIPPAFELFDCDEIISKVQLYAVERTEAFAGYGFTKTDTCLIGGNDGYAYNGYWTLRKK
ncbi:MAG: GNAT family N-acetyltransferase [Treponema sp.]|nr:GNAT family N-acetyltransferase [Treponema sp.]